MEESSGGQSPSRPTTARFVTSLSDFHLPQRSPTAGHQGHQNNNHHHHYHQLSPGSSSSASHTPSQPVLTGGHSPSGFDVENGGVASMPLLRRAAAANGARMRRTSMLGREVLGRGARGSMSEDDENSRHGEDDEMRGQAAVSPTSTTTTLTRGQLMRRRGPLQREESPTLRGRSFAAREKRNLDRKDKREDDIDDEDDDMEVDTGDVTLSGIEMRDKSSAAAAVPSTPPLHPTMLSSSHDNNSSPLPRTGVVRRAVNRRANLMPKDRGMLRVAATLRDESRPSDVEIASEAKLQRKLGPDSDAPLVNRLGSPAHWNPAGAGGSGGTYYPAGAGNDRWGDEDDFSHALHRADEVLSDFGDESSDEGATTTTTATLVGLGVGQTNGMLDAETEAVERGAPGGSRSGPGNLGISIPNASGLSTSASSKASLWLGFREGSRQSPGVERAMTKSRSSTISVHTPTEAQPMLSTSMDVEPPPSAPSTAATATYPVTATNSNGGGPGAGNHPASSPSLWGRSAKRKVGDERFDPYASSALYKRRAVSPIALISASASSSAPGGATATVRASTPTTSSMASTSNAALISPFALQTHNTAGLPVPTPISIPSPTLAPHHGGTFSTSPYPRVTGSRSSSGGAPSSYFGAKDVAAGGGAGIGVAIPGAVSAAASASASSARPMWTRGSRANSPAALASNAGGGGGGGSVTRPSTPTNSTYAPLYSGPGPSPSLLSTSAGKLGTPGSAATPGPATKKGGSGPGYGSGALGLSLGGGSKGLREEEEEEMEDEGMLGDVSAIQLG